MLIKEAIARSSLQSYLAMASSQGAIAPSSHQSSKLLKRSLQLNSPNQHCRTFRENVKTFIRNMRTFIKNVAMFKENVGMLIENARKLIKNVVLFKGKQRLFALPLQNAQ
jgi:hypothetical protein